MLTWSKIFFPSELIFVRPGMLTGMYVFLPPDYGLKSTLSSQWMEAAVVAYALIDLCEKSQGE